MSSSFILRCKWLMGHQILDITDLYICPLPEFLPKLCEAPTISLMFSPIQGQDPETPPSQRVAQTLNRL